METEVFEDELLSNEMLKQLNEYRKSENNQFCDWILKTLDGGEFPVHKCVIASGCPYFKSLFNSNLAESREESMVLTKLSKDSLQNILDYLYSGKIEINENNMKRIFEDASYLMLKRLKNFCADFMLKSINDEENFLELWRFVATNGCELMSRKCLMYISEHADRLLTVKFSNGLEIDEVLAILKENSLNCSEDKICELVISWINHNYDKRNIHIQKLFDEIRLPLLSEYFMTSYLFKNELLKKNDLFMSIALDTCKIKMELNQKNHFVMNKSMIPRYGNRKKELYVIKNNECCAYVNNNFNLKMPLDYLYSNYSACTVFYENFLFVGGLSGDRKQCRYYCSIQNKWRYFLPMNESREHHDATFIRDKIYVCGGNNMTTEYFDFSKESWLTGPKLIKNGQYFGPCSVESINDCIYVVGGNLIKKLDLREGKWIEVAQTPQSYFKTCIDQNYLYCMNSTGGIIFDIRNKKYIDKSIPSYSCTGQNSNVFFDVHMKDNVIYLYRNYNSRNYSCQQKLQYWNLDTSSSWSTLHEEEKNISPGPVALVLLYS